MIDLFLAQCWRQCRHRRLCRLALAAHPSLALDQILLLFGELLTPLQVELSVKVDLTLDEGHFRPRIDTERMTVEDCEVCILADIDAAHTVVDEKLLCRVER